MTTYQLNDTVTLANDTIVVGTTATDPATLSLHVTNGSNVTTTYAVGALTHPGTGLYTKAITPTTDGEWSWLFVGTGVDNGTQGGAFTVLNGNIYGTRSELKAIVFSGATSDTIDDALLDLALLGASRWIDGYCNRPAGFNHDTTDTTRTYKPTSWLARPMVDAQYEIHVDDLVSLTTLKTDDDGDGIFENTWSASDYQLLPENQTGYGDVWPSNGIRAVGTRVFPWQPVGARRHNLVQVTGKFGWPAIPTDVKNACLLLAHAAYERRKTPAGVIGGFPEMGGLRVGTKIDPDVSRWLGPYRNLRGAMVA